MVLPCACAPQGPPPGEQASAPPPPDYAQLAADHNARIDLLQRLHARGVIEIRWEDDRGRHFEQGDAQIWLDLPWNTAVRVEKLGDVLLWLGSDEREYWMFDMLGDETVLRHQRHGGTAPAGAGASLGLSPQALLDLLGLGRLPTPAPGRTPAERPAVVFDPKQEAWRVTTWTADPAGPSRHGLRLLLDAQTRLPKRVEVLRADGSILARSSLRRYRRVEQSSSLSVNWPWLATLADVTRPDGADSLKLALESPTGIVDESLMQRIFDLERLMQAMPPDRIEPFQAAEN